MLIDDVKTIIVELEAIHEVVENPPSHLSSNGLTLEKLKIAKQIFTESKAIQNKVFSDVKDGCDLDL